MGTAKDIAEVAGSVVTPITKLIECISGALGKTFEPRRMKKKAEAEAERIKILSEALRENCDIPITINSNEISLSTTDYDDFLKRTQTRMAYQELKKQQNIENVANKAVAVLADEEAVAPDPVDQDWLMRFFNTVEDVGNEEMQEIWARLLAGEVKKPGTFSLRTLETLRNMTHEEAVAFEKMCAHCIMIVGSHAILQDEGYLRIPLIIAPKPSTSSPRPKFREKAQFKRTICTRNKPRYATFIRLRARYKFASANSVQQC